jgi:hypothetical protein
LFNKDALIIFCCVMYFCWGSSGGREGTDCTFIGCHSHHRGKQVEEHVIQDMIMEGKRKGCSASWIWCCLKEAQSQTQRGQGENMSSPEQQV